MNKEATDAFTYKNELGVPVHDAKKPTPNVTQKKENQERQITTFKNGDGPHEADTTLLRVQDAQSEYLRNEVDQICPAGQQHLGPPSTPTGPKKPVIGQELHRPRGPPPTTTEPKKPVFGQVGHLPLKEQQGYPGQPPPGYPQHGYPPGYPPHGYPPGYPPQGYPPGYPPQGYPPQGYPGYPQQGYSPPFGYQGYPQPGYPPQGYPQQGYPMQDRNPQAAGSSMGGCCGPLLACLGAILCCCGPALMSAMGGDMREGDTDVPDGGPEAETSS